MSKATKKVTKESALPVSSQKPRVRSWRGQVPYRASCPLWDPAHILCAALRVCFCYRELQAPPSQSRSKITATATWRLGLLQVNRSWSSRGSGITARSSREKRDSSTARSESTGFAANRAPTLPNAGTSAKTRPASKTRAVRVTDDCRQRSDRHG